MNLLKKIFGKKDAIKQSKHQSIFIARKHHYIFTHKYLNKLFFENPKGLICKLLAKDGTKFLNDIWMNIGNACDIDERIPPTGLKISEFLQENKLIILITLPEPKFLGEAYFIGIVALLNPANIEDIKGVIYYMLEFTVVDKPVICSWDDKGNHGYYGLHIDPEESKFLKFLVGKVDPDDSPFVKFIMGK